MNRTFSLNRRTGIVLLLLCCASSRIATAAVTIAMPEVPHPAQQAGKAKLQEALAGVKETEAFTIIIGAQAAAFPKSNLNGLGDEGFIIAPVEQGIVIAGNTPLAEAYGMAYLAERIRIGLGDWRRLRVRRVPYFKVRLASGCTAEEALLRGYNGWSATPSAASVVTFQAYEQDFFPPDILAQQQENARAARRNLDAVHALGLQSFGGGDEFQFPAAILDRPYAAALTELDDPKELCVASEKLWEIYRAKFAEYVKTFPDVDFYKIRLGENYSHLKGGALVGNGVYRYHANNAYCDRCKDIPYEDRIAQIINETQAILGDSPIRYMHRTWDTHHDLIHGDSGVFQRILAKVPEREKILWSIKYTKTDFWRYNFPNPCIGVGDVPQIIEFQCAREYEGKGAYPNYIGWHTAKGHRYAAEKGAEGVWHWHHGGGWGGPYLATDLWNEANIYLAAQLAWEPEADPVRLAHEWACMTFGNKAAPYITELLTLSTDATLKLRYFEAYCRDHYGWVPAHNWMRDDKIRGEAMLEPIYNGAKDYVDAMIAEKATSLRLVQDMHQLAEQASAGIATEKEIIPPHTKGSVFIGDWVPEKSGTHTVSLSLQHGSDRIAIPIDLTVAVSEYVGVLNHTAGFECTLDNRSYTGKLEIPRKAGVGKHHPVRITLPPVCPAEELQLTFIQEDGKATSCTLRRPDGSGTLRAHLMTSMAYLEALTEVGYHYSAAYFLYRRWQDIGDDTDKQEALRHARAWQTAWERYRTEIPGMQGAASLYNDDGMVATMSTLRKALEG